MPCYPAENALCWVCSKHHCTMEVKESIVKNLLQNGITNPTNEQIEAAARLLKDEFEPSLIAEALEDKGGIRRLLDQKLGEMGQMKLF